MKVYFFQPKNFNRTADRTNPFFDPIIEVCERNGIEWQIYNPGRRSSTGYQKNKVYDSRKLRRFVSRFGKIFAPVLGIPTDYEIDKLAGKVYNILTFGRHRADIYITVAEEARGALAGINPNARIVDVQHGVFSIGHPSYIESNGSISRLLLQCPKREVWVAGDGYRDLFLKKEENRRWVDGHVKIAGDFVRHELTSPDLSTPPSDRIVLFSLQITNELSCAQNYETMQMTQSFLEKFVAEGGDCRKVVLRHHPRHTGSPDVTSLLEKFPGVKISVSPLSELLRSALVHVTITSTAAFDAAAAGVPTYFICSEGRLPSGFGAVGWGEDLGYPFWGMRYRDIENMALASPEHTAEKMHEWFRNFYRELDDTTISDLLCTEENTP